jgi:LETM1 and EF-hand domain-containing protein 1
LVVPSLKNLTAL